MRAPAAPRRLGYLNRIPARAASQVSQDSRGSNSSVSILPPAYESFGFLVYIFVYDVCARGVSGQDDINAVTLGKFVLV